MNQPTFAQRIHAERGAGTPLVAIETRDSMATIQSVMAALNTETPFLQWDVVRMTTALNKAGMEAVGKMDQTVSPIRTVESAMANLPGRVPGDTTPGAVLFLHAGSVYVEKNEDFSAIEFTQALLLARDELKRNLRMIVLLGPTFHLSPELDGHITVIEDTPPTKEIIEEVVKGFPVALTNDEASLATAALLGLSTRFQVEQAIATSLVVNGKTTLNFDRLWERKRKMISETPGLEYQMGGCSFDDMLGNTEAAAFGRAVNRGRRRPEAIILLDEGEDQSGGHKNDSSGVAQKMIGKLATELQDRKYRGQMNFGIHGCGKSLYAKAMAGDAGVPLIIMTIGEIEDSLVGNSSKRLAQALDVINTVSNGNAYWIMTSNDLGGIPTKIRDRFSYGGVWMFDMPDTAGVAALFEFYLKRHGLESHVPDIAKLDLSGWTPRNVEWCVEKAWDLNLTLPEAAARVIPYGKANAREVEAIRNQAHGKYLDAARPGAYHCERAAMERAAFPSSTIRMVEGNV